MDDLRQPLYDLYWIQNELREPSLQLEELEATADAHDSMTSGSYYEIQAKSHQEMFGSVPRLIARCANKERIAKGLEPIEWPDRLADICPMIKFVVVEEHTLGVIKPDRPEVIEKLAISVLQGATFGSQHDDIHQPWPAMRPATLADFTTFRLSTTGYESSERYDFPLV